MIGIIFSIRSNYFISIAKRFSSIQRSVMLLNVNDPVGDAGRVLAALIAAVSGEIEKAREHLGEARKRAIAILDLTMKELKADALIARGGKRVAAERPNNLEAGVFIVGVVRPSPSAPAARPWPTAWPGARTAAPCTGPTPRRTPSTRSTSNRPPARSAASASSRASRHAIRTPTRSSTGSRQIER